MPNHVKQTQGVKTLLGDPKKALIKLSLPIIAANFIQTIYSIADTFWVSGLGANALASVGLFFPFFFVSIAIGIGLGAGGGSAIARRIGSHDQEGASKVATHTIVITILFAVAYTIPLILFAKPIFIKIGAGDTLPMVLAYSKIMFAGSFILFFSNIAAAILRSEGDTKRAMWAMAFGSVLNIILDPLFIYTFKLGVAGAAYATVLSMTISSLIMFDWLFLKKNTYVTLHFKRFRFDPHILKDILKVGFPASFSMISMSISMFIMNVIIVKIGGTDGVAVYSTGWRILMVATMPAFGIATALVALTGAAYGAKDYKKLSIAYHYAVKAGIIIEIPAVILVYFLAPPVASVFTQAESAMHIAPDLINFLRITSLSYPAIALGPASSSMFQGIGKGFNALTVTILRTILLMPPLVILFAMFFNRGLTGIWWGVVTANGIGAIVAFSWAKLYIRRLNKQTS